MPIPVQYFKGDETEKKFFEVANYFFNFLSSSRSDFYDQAYFCYDLGELLYNAKSAPLTNIIPIEVFKDLFAIIFDYFDEAGSAESYLVVFRAIFGDDVEVTFDVPAPGKLTIDIVAEGVEFSLFTVKEIIDGEYVYSDIVDTDGDNIIFKGIKGLGSQYEVEQMLYELVPAGIYTEISLTLGA